MGLDAGFVSVVVPLELPERAGVVRASKITVQVLRNRDDQQRGSDTHDLCSQGTLRWTCFKAGRRRASCAQSICVGSIAKPVAFEKRFLA